MRIPQTSKVCSGLLGSAILVAAGCANPPSQTLQSLTISATPAAALVGSPVALKALAHLSDGTNQDVTSSTLFTLSDASLATMSNGVLTGKAAGTLSVQGAYIVVVPANTSSSQATAGQTLSASAQVAFTANTAPLPTPPVTATNIPLITWPTPQPINYGTAIDATQLNASANVAGTFSYAPVAGTVLATGSQTLTVTFTPADLQNYEVANDTVQLSVGQTKPVITWGTLASVPTGTALSGVQLDATANVAGSFVYSPALGSIPTVGVQSLTVKFTPADTVNYTTALATDSLVVLPVTAGDLLNATNWEWNHDPGTPGSSDGSTVYPQLSPATPDNAARKFYVNYAAHGGEIFHLSFAKDVHVANFVYDTYIYLVDPTEVMNVEMDMNQVMADGRTVIFGTQCAGGSGSFEYTLVTNGKTHWHASNIPCDPRKWSPNTWHHVQIASHRDDAGNVGYDWVTLDGVTTKFKNATGNSAESLGWPKGDLLINFQLDGAHASGTITAYLDQLTIHRW